MTSYNQKCSTKGAWNCRRALQIMCCVLTTTRGLQPTISRHSIPVVTHGFCTPHHMVPITSISYEIDRKAYNKELQELLSKNLLADATTAIQQLRDQGFVLNVDTIHILISDAFARKMPDTAEELYVQYFQTGTLSPTTRTLNILMEGFRNVRDDMKVDYYRNRFAHHNVVMDTYSYSTWVRQCKTAKHVRAVVRKAIRDGSISSAFLRCAVESLGKLGDPQGALTVAGRLLYNLYPNPPTISPPVMSSSTSSPIIDADISTSTSSAILSKRASRGVFRSASSGDSLMVALLENPSIKLLPADATELNWLSGNAESSSTIDDNNHDTAGPPDTIDKGSEGSDQHKDNGYDLETVSDLERMLANQSCGEAAIALVLLGAADVSASASAKATTPPRTTQVDTNVLITDAAVADAVAGAVVGAVASASSSTIATITDNHGQPWLDNRTLSLGSKGWCRLFTFLQRSIRDALTSQVRDINTPALTHPHAPLTYTLTHLYTYSHAPLTHTHTPLYNPPPPLTLRNA